MRGPATGALLFVLWVAGCGGPAPAPAPSSAAEVPRYDIEAFLDVDSWGGASFAPDNRKVVVHGDSRGVFNLYEIPVEGGDPVRLTASDESTFSAGYFPGDERILFLRDRGGDENSHLYVREIDGTERDLTPGEGIKASFVDWSGDGATFWVATNERDRRYFDVYAYEAATYARKNVFRNEAGWEIDGVSPDGRWLALGKPVTTSDGDLFVHDLRKGKTSHLTPHRGAVLHRFQDFSHDGRFLYFTTDEGSEFSKLVRLDLETGERAVVADPPWDVLYASVSHAGTYLVAGINEDARTTVSVHDGTTLALLPPIELPESGSIESVLFSRDESKTAVWAGSDRTLPDLWVAPTAGGPFVRLTRSLSGTIDPEVLVEPEIVRFESYDGTEIPGLLYMPRQASATSKVPALVWVHGGPGGQSRVGYSDLIQYLVNHGYAVYAINNRGSSGYGKTFYGMDDRNHGEADLDDCVASKAMLAETGKIDPDRIGILGGSYGGYMVLAALAFRPEEFRVGVDIFGVSNWVRTLESIPPYWESFRKALYEEMGDPLTDADRLRRISPVFHAEKIRRPLMVLQGANDPRVLKIESDEIVEAVRANGVPVEYVVFDDEGHGFRKKKNQEVGYRKILEFLQTHL
jgi:dipeptidyl aminopeptidase/acylaminoacyl peptidase